MCSPTLGMLRSAPKSRDRCSNLAFLKLTPAECRHHFYDRGRHAYESSARFFIGRATHTRRKHAVADGLMVSEDYRRKDVVGEAVDGARLRSTYG